MTTKERKSLVGLPRPERQGRRFGVIRMEGGGRWLAALAVLF